MNDTATNESRRIIASEGYAEQVYAGLLGKVIGVYLGRPIENWTYESIQERLGDIEYYVHDKLGVPLIVTDDDIAGTITFLRAAEDSGQGYDTSAMDVAACWLNYLIENRSVLWWGGVGNSTEHTAYMRLKDGYQPPYSGSIELNSKTVAEQIGSQIFIDGWAMIAPGSPQLAAELARRASTVSHDGEAIYGAQMLAAMESMAFVTADINTIIDAGLAQIPSDSVIATMIADIRHWHDTEPDWRKAREKLQANYGYELYGGNCHMVPNHGLIILALLYGTGDFSRSMMIVNTAGWDTDCNSGNLGCLLGIMHGLAGLESEHDWRGPVADRIYVPTADAGSGITDVVLESLRITNIARAAVGLESLAPKNGARFHFSFPGSVQGFTILGAGSVANTELPDSSARGLLITATEPISVVTPTFIPPEARTMPGGYALDVSPTIYSGQEMTIDFLVTSEDVNTVADVAVFARHYNGEDQLVEVHGPPLAVTAGRNSLSWIIPDTSGQPIADIGLMVRPRAERTARLYLDRVDWSGTPTITLRRPADGGTMWRRAWVDNLDHQEWRWPESFRLIANTRERRVMVTGSPNWQDYAVEAALTPHMADSMGIAARVQGLQRYYLLRCDRGGELQLIKRDGEDHVLARAPFSWRPENQIRLRLEVNGGTLQGFVDGKVVISAWDDLHPLRTGGVAVTCEAGRVGCDQVMVEPLVPSTETEVAHMALQTEMEASR